MYTEIKTCPFEDLNIKEQKLIDIYIKTGDRHRAYSEAGYSMKGQGWKVNSRKKFMQLAPLIEERINMRVGEGALLAFGVVKELMQTASSEAVRLNAAKDYLSRAGHDLPVSQKVEITDNTKLTDEQLDHEINSLMGKKGSDDGELTH